MEKSSSGFKKFLLLWAGELISSIGGGLTSFGLAVYVFNETGSAASMAMVSLLEPGRKSCVKADKLQSRERGQIEGQPVLGTGRLNQAYPPVFREGRRHARAA